MTQGRADIEVPVLVVGGGAVGLTLAIDLAWRGVEVLVVERRARSEPPPPKCNHVAARSMEIFRRLGVAGKLRNAGLPPDYPNDISYRTSFTGRELTRIPIPCRRDRYDATDGPDCGWPTPEPPHRINQIFLEPILFDHAFQQPRIRILEQATVEDYEVAGDHVLATATGRDGSTTRVACRYLVGCDGGRSAIRRCMGAKFEGDAVVQRVQSTFIRALDLIGRQREAPAWATFSLNPRRSGNVYAIDGAERWVVHNYLKPEEADFAAVDRDRAIREILGVGPDFEYQVLLVMDWFGRRLVADRFHDGGRVFICGDAAHIWVPYAGYGMNAGIADAADLAWLLAAHLNGWAPAAILDAYQRERHPITSQVSHFVMDHAHAMASQRGGVPASIEEDGPAGDAARAALGEQAYRLNVQQYCCAGLNFGSFYDASPLIAYDGAAPPGYTMAEFTPSTVPGCRLPHVWLDGGRSLYDALGPDYTLLRFDPAADAAPLLAAAERRGVPLAVLDVAPQPPYDHKLVLARPDQHVAWRGDALPADPLALVGRIRGAA
jgi:2-polyprenyl-6-methoxyphenol hydroxylase-like FAD-dependent oxidoreductase